MDGQCQRISGTACETYVPAKAPMDFPEIVVLSVFIGLVLLVSVFNLYLGLGALALLLAGLILGMNLRRSILGLIFLLPFDPQIELKSGAYLYFDLLFILPSLVYLWKVVFEKYCIRWPSLALGPYVLFAIASSFWRTENFFWFSAYSARLAIAVLFMAAVAGMGRAGTVTLVLGASLIPQVIYGVYQLLAGEVGSLYALIYPHYQSQPWTDRAYGFFFQPNNFGSYCATVSVMLLALGLRSRTARVRIACYTLASFGFIGLASSGSRGAWLGAIAGMALLFLYSRASVGTKVALAGAAFVGVLLALSLQYAPLERVESLDSVTIEGRTTMNLAALLLFLQHPWIGVGLTNYQVLMTSVVTWEFGAGNAAHNAYLEILSENGIIGFMLFFGPAYYFFFQNLKRARDSTASLICAAGLAVFLVHALFDFQFAAGPQYLFVYAVIFGLASRRVGTHAALATGRR